MTHHIVELRDGRHVGVTGLGDPEADRLVLMCHPSPGAGGFDPDPPATSTAGVRIITLDRPGYGSLKQPWKLGLLRSENGTVTVVPAPYVPSNGGVS